MIVLHYTIYKLKEYNINEHSLLKTRLKVNEPTLFKNFNRNRESCLFYV